MFTYDGKTLTLAEMLDLKKSDAAFRQWLRGAKPGDFFEGCECIALPQSEGQRVAADLAYMRWKQDPDAQERAVDALTTEEMQLRLMRKEFI